jgi:hypothetical protein
VARIGLVPDEVLLSQFAALVAIAPGRVIAAMGTGDRLSAEENLAYGLGFAPAGERRAELRRVAAELLRRGIEVWIGGGAAPTVSIADELGCAVNLWAGDAGAVAAQAASGKVTWAGLAPADDDELARLLAEIEGAGATWAVVGNVGDPSRLTRASSG